MEDDEGLHAAIAQEMVERGDWTVPRLLGEPFLDKPILYFWMQAASIAAFGASEFAVRLPGTRDGAAPAPPPPAGWPARCSGRRSARWAALCYATMLLPFGVSLAPLHDLVMVPLVTVAIGAFWHARQTASVEARWPAGPSSPAWPSACRCSARASPASAWPASASRPGWCGRARCRGGWSPSGRSRWPSAPPSPGRGTRRWSAPCPAISTTSSPSGTSPASPTTRSATPAGRSGITCRSCWRARWPWGVALWRRVRAMSDGERLLWAGWSADVVAAQPGRVEAGHLPAAGVARRGGAGRRPDPCAAGRRRRRRGVGAARRRGRRDGTGGGAGGTGRRLVARHAARRAEQLAVGPRAGRRLRVVADRGSRRPGPPPDRHRGDHADGRRGRTADRGRPADGAAAGRAHQPRTARAGAPVDRRRRHRVVRLLSATAAAARSDRRARRARLPFLARRWHQARRRRRRRGRRPRARRARALRRRRSAADPRARIPRAAARRLPPALDRRCRDVAPVRRSDAC